MKTTHSAKTTAELCCAILEVLAAETVRGCHEIEESVLAARVVTDLSIDDMIDELVDAGHLRSTIVETATGLRAALVLTDRGYGAWQEIVDRKAA